MSYKRCKRQGCRRKAIKVYCSKQCSGHCAGKARRGINPDRHIRVRLPDGSRRYLHILKAEEWLGRRIDPETEIVHHIDEVKHHNCTPIEVTCGDPLCFGNLEVLTEDARREHLRRHAAQMYLRRIGRYEPYTEEDFKDYSAEVSPFAAGEGV